MSQKAQQLSARPYTISLLASASLERPIVGAWVVVTEATGTFTIALDGGDPIAIEKGLALYIDDGEEPFKSINVADTSGAANTITLYVGQGNIIDRRFVPANSLPAPPVLDSIADVTLAATATTLILAASADRREALIHNLDAGTEVRIGDSGAGATNGLPLAADATLSLNTSGAIHGYNPSGAGVDIAVVSFEE